MQKIYLSWSKWYFWSHIKTYLSNDYEIISWSVDIRNYQELLDEINLHNPDIIINAAWKTWVPNVDWCESNKEQTLTVNVAGAINIASIASDLGVYFVHIWSWCIFEWDNWGRWFTEEDSANFDWSFYSRTKTISEIALKEFDALQLRIRIPIEWNSCPKNVINKLIKYDKIISVDNSFTVVEDFLSTLKSMIKDKRKWVYNMTNEWYCNHEFIMNLYKEIVDQDFSFEVMSLESLAKITAAKRSNCVLNTDKREGQWYSMPNIKDRLPDIMQKYRDNSM